MSSLISVCLPPVTLGPDDDRGLLSELGLQPFNFQALLRGNLE